MPEDLSNEFSTLCFLRSFSKTITTILEILKNDSEHAESLAHKQITELLSNEQWGLTKMIQDIEPKLYESPQTLLPSKSNLHT
ncbi:MAG TPA: hypothetical protein DCL61_22960 [Cyanobacteria bacterium UBA12227]|nr:hypothetical protein [Cyanobacteria bacterium UBA12227]HAX85426.1 hypothetical protein [Cyanobacteria bacterium UBA11370]